MRKLLLAGTTVLVLSGALYGALGDPGSLMDAVKAGNLSAVRKTLHQRVNPNQAERDGTTALHWAVQANRLDIAEALIAAGADVNVKNHYGATPLAVSLIDGNSAIAKLLLNAGANPRVQVPEMGTALLAAAHTGDPEVIRELLKGGVNVNEAEPTTGQTALMRAAAEGHEAAVKVLLSAGADYRVRGVRGETALFLGVRGGSIGVVDALLAGGADVNERADSETDAKGHDQPGDSMLVVAIVNAHFALADFLLNKGADPNAAGARWTPLHALSRVRDYEETQYPPPMIKPGEMDSLEFGRRLIAHGANVNARAQTMTVRRNAGDQNYKDLVGATPFFLASKSGDVPYMRLLISSGADVTTPLDDHTTPLMVAAGIGCVPGQWIEPERDVLAAVKLLVEDLNADVNAANDEKETPVHGAVCRGADSVIQYLVDKGAKLNVKDEDGQTPLDIVLNGLNRAVSLNGPRIIIFHSPDHTVTLVKKLAEERRAADSATARR